MIVPCICCDREVDVSTDLIFRKDSSHKVTIVCVECYASFSLPWIRTIFSLRNELYKNRTETKECWLSIGRILKAQEELEEGLYQ